MSGHATIETAVLVSELGDDQVLVRSVVQPKLAAVGSLVDARIELELVLSAYFASLRPDQLARFDTGAPSLRTVRVLVPHADLRGKHEIKVPIDVPCVVTRARPRGEAAPEASDLWVHIVPLEATAYVRAGEDFDAIVRSEVQRLARARELRGTEYLALLPPLSTALETLHVPLGSVSPGARGIAGLRAEVKAQERRDADALLCTVSRPFHERPRARPCLMRGRELAQLDVLLSGEARASVLVVGEAGAGKSALIASWYEAQREQGTAPPVYVTSGAQLLAGMGGAGEWQARLEQVLEAAERLDAVLYVEDMHDLLLSRREQGDDLAGYLRPWLDAARVRFVGELRKDALLEAERRHHSFLAALNRVALDPLPEQADLTVLEAHAAHHRKHEPHRAQLSHEALVALVDVASRYLPYAVHPGGIVLLYDELRAVDRLRTAEHGAQASAHDVYTWFSTRTGVPLFLLRDDVSLRRETLARELDRMLVGQHEAKRAIVDTLCVVKARLAPRDKPLSSFLFVGPTGVGKTELARALAEVLFQDGERMVRFDMSEYGDAQAAARLIHGSESSDGLLTRKVREQPFCVLLLDEIEKAHPAVYDLLLQVLGEGRLSDARGRTAYFHNAIVIMTSNLGTSTRSVAGFGERSAQDASVYFKAARDAFRPEFLNRIDRIVPFAPLSRGELAPVVRMLVDRVVQRRGLREAGVELSLSEGALSSLAEGGFSEAYGARGVRRHLETALATPLSRLLSLHARTPRANLISVHAEGEHEAASTAPEALVAGGLCFVMGQRSARPQAAKTPSGLSLEVTATRRRLLGWLSLARVEALSEQREALVVELAQAAKKKAPPALMASLEARHHALRAALEPLREAYDEVCSVEDLCLFALWRGDAPPAFEGEVARAELRFKEALLRALMADEPQRHALTLRLSELDDGRALDLWLARYLAHAERLGHNAVLHLDRGGTGPRFGKAISAEEGLERVLSPERSFRHVLLCVEGPEALALLGLEAGHVCYRQGGEPDASLGVTLIARAADLTESELADSALTPPGHEALALLRRTKPSRLFDGSAGTLSILGGRQTLPIAAAEHFARIEEIALAHLLLFEQHGELDRDDLFMPALHRGKRR